MAHHARGVAAEQVVGDAGLVGFEEDQVRRDPVGEAQDLLVHLAEPDRRGDVPGTDVEAGSLCAVVDPLSAVSYRLYRGRESRIRFHPYRPAVPFGIGILTPVHKPRSRIARAFLPALKDDILASAEGWRDDAVL